MRKDLGVLISGIWAVLVVFGLLTSLLTNYITTDTFYLGMVGCGIWQMLLNLYNKE